MPTLEITTTIGCPLACTFCPQDKLSIAYGNTTTKRLEISTFKEIMAKIPKYVRIDFSGYVEPFSHSQCDELIDIAIESGHPVCLYTTLQGVKTNYVERLVDYIESGLINPFVIHLPDDSGNMPGFKLQDSYIEILSRLLPREQVTTMTMSPTAQVLPELYTKLRSLDNADILLSKLPKDSFTGSTRAGSLNTKKVEENQLVKVKGVTPPLSCSTTPFYDHNVLLPDGRVQLCCMDYSLKHTIGNIIDSSYSDLFVSKSFTELLLRNRGLEKNCGSICLECDLAQNWSIAQDSTWVSNSKTSFFSLLKKKIKSALTSMFPSL